MIAWSNLLSARAAAIAPNGTDVRIATISVQIVRDKVGSTRCPINLDTGRLLKIDVPKSPCINAQTQFPKRTIKG